MTPAELLRYRKLPLAFAVEVLGIAPESLDHPELVEVVDRVRRREWRTLVEHDPAVGISHTFAWLSLWFAACFTPSKVILLAPKLDQLKNHEWAEVQRYFPAFQKHFPHAQLSPSSLNVGPEGRGNSTIRLESARVVAGGDAVTAMHGLFSPHLLILVSDVEGVSPAVIRALKDTLTGEHNLMVCAKWRDVLSGFERVQVRGAAHPNVVQGRKVVPGAITGEWLEAHGA